MIIFGWGKTTTKVVNDVEVNNCTNCNNSGYWDYIKVTTWFTLFFIPVIPYKTIYVKVCKICNVYEYITNEQFISASEGSSIPNSSPEKPMAEDYSGMTETQINYKKQMAEHNSSKNK